MTQADLTTFAGDAVVNAANSGLAGGGGVDGAIHRAAGPDLPPACREIIARRGPLAPGEAALTPGFGLKAKYIIHAVGPVWRGGHEGEPTALGAAYAASLRLAGEAGAKSVAFAAISCGVYGYPLDQAAAIAVTEIAAGLRRDLVREAGLYLFGPEIFRVFMEQATQALGRPGEPDPPGMDGAA